MTLLKLTENLSVIDLDSSSSNPLGRFVKKDDVTYVFEKTPHTEAITDVETQIQIEWISYNLNP